MTDSHYIDILDCSGTHVYIEQTGLKTQRSVGFCFPFPAGAAQSKEAESRGLERKLAYSSLRFNYVLEVCPAHTLMTRSYVVSTATSAIRLGRLDRSMGESVTWFPWRQTLTNLPRHGV